MFTYEPSQKNEYSPISGEYSIEYESFQDPASPLDYRWELLLQIDTESGDGVDIMWCGCGVANFFVPKGNLQKMDFSEIWYNCDCC